jgi:hypothetical protein
MTTVPKPIYMTRPYPHGARFETRLRPRAPHRDRRRSQCDTTKRRSTHVPKLQVDDRLATLPDCETETRVAPAPAVDEPRPAALLQDSGICPACLARNAIEAPVDFEGWGDRPRRIGPCISCARQLFYIPGDSMLIVWNLGD